ncbi:MAG: biopolymer transporter ExbD [Chitinophagaceae bacterium]|nr:biopolymer transporter ExbD [Chitinophagaceae bacterium]
MASIDSSPSTTRRLPGVHKAARLSTKVDMTPMVDLGFLLITFFIFTATVTTPKAMDLNMPADVPLPMPVAKTGVLTIIPGDGNHVFYYEGELDASASNFKATNIAGIRDVIIQKKKEVTDRYVTNAGCESRAAGDPEKLRDCRQEKLFVVIKPGKEASYKNVVDVLDEMTINQVKRYALVKIMPVEEELVRISEGK